MSRSTHTKDFKDARVTDDSLFDKSKKKTVNQTDITANEAAANDLTYPSVRLVSNVDNIALDETTTTIDGIAVADENEVLVNEQLDPTLNGIWKVSTTTAWTRSATAIRRGMLVTVREGNHWKRTIWQCINTSDPAVDTDEIHFKEQAPLQVTVDNVDYVARHLTFEGTGIATVEIASPEPGEALTLQVNVDAPALIGAYIQAPVTGATGASADITTALATACATAGYAGSSVALQPYDTGVPGFIVTAPYNRVLIWNAGTKKKIKSAAGDEVYGRLTVSGTPPRETYGVSFYTEAAGVETSYSFGSSTDLDAEVHYLFSIADVPEEFATALTQRHVQEDPETTASYCAGYVPVTGVTIAGLSLTGDIFAGSLSSAGVGGTSVPEQPSATDTVEGVITSSANNRVELYRSTGEKINDGAGNEVYARITGTATNWTLTWYSLVAGVETAHTPAASIDGSAEIPYRFRTDHAPTTVNIGLQQRRIYQELRSASGYIDPTKIRFVDNGWSSPLSPRYTTIQAAIDAAASGETVVIYPGVYAENIQLKDGVNIYGHSGVTIKGTGDTTAAIRDGGSAVTCKITGHIKIKVADGAVYGIITGNASTNLTVEADELYTDGFPAYTGDGIRLSGGTVLCRFNKINGFFFHLLTTEADNSHLTVYADEISEGILRCNSTNSSVNVYADYIHIVTGYDSGWIYTSTSTSTMTVQSRLIQNFFAPACINHASGSLKIRNSSIITGSGGSGGYAPVRAYGNGLILENCQIASIGKNRAAPLSLKIADATKVKIVGWCYVDVDPKDEVGAVPDSTHYYCTLPTTCSDTGSEFGAGTANDIYEDINSGDTYQDDNSADVYDFNQT